MKEVEISIKGLIFYILKHWKSIFVAMFLGAIALSGLQMIRSVRSVQNAPSTADIVSSLTDSEKTYVESTYEFLQSLRRANEIRRESLIMNLDPQNLFKTELIYNVTVEDDKTIAGVESSYIYFLTDSDFYGFISEKTGISDSDIADTVTVSYERSRYETSSTTVNISVISDEKKTSEEIANAVDAYIGEKNRSLSLAGYEHGLTRIAFNTVQGSDFSVQELQIRYFQELQSRTKIILDTEAALKDAQKEYYKSLMDSSDEDSLGESEDDDSDLNNTFVRPSFKYIFFGLFVGAFLICGIYFLIYIFSNKLDENDDVESVYGTYLIGKVTGNDYGKLIHKLKNLGKRTFDFDESIKIIVSRIKMSSCKDGVSKIGIIGCGIKKNNEKAMTKLLNGLKAEGVEAIVIDDPLYDPTCTKTLSEIDHGILLEKIGVTYRNEIWEEVDMLKKLNVALDGMVIVE